MPFFFNTMSISSIFDSALQVAIFCNLLSAYTMTSKDFSCGTYSTLRLVLNITRNKYCQFRCSGFYNAVS